MRSYHDSNLRAPIVRRSTEARGGAKLLKVRVAPRRAPRNSRRAPVLNPVGRTPKQPVGFSKPHLSLMACVRSEYNPVHISDLECMWASIQIF